MAEKDLLKVLDMSEDEQWDWLCDKRVWRLGAVSHLHTRNEILADLAFRLRDEATTNLMNWDAAKIDVWEYYCKREKREIQLELFWIDYSRPIHWIVASLIALEKK